MRALELLEWDTVQAVVFEGDELAGRLREIDENLMRHELTALDRATFLAERQSVYEALHPETKQNGNRDLGPQKQFVATVGGFAKNAAERLGFDKRTIERAVRMHARLNPDARRRGSGTWLADHAQQLDLLASCKGSEQLAAINLLFGAAADGFVRPKTVGAALDQVRGVVLLPPNPDDAAFAAFLSLWRKRSPAFRRRVRDFAQKEKVWCPA